MIVGLIQNEQLHVSAGPADQRLQIEFPADFDEGEEVVVARTQLAFTMTELGLTDEMLVTAPPPNRSLDSLERLVDERAILSADGAGSFERSELAPELAAFRVPDQRPCPSFDFERLDLDSGFSQSGAMLPDGRYLVAATTNLLVLGGEPPVREVEFPGEQVYRADVDPQGRAWVLTSHSLSQLDVDTGERRSPVDTSSIGTGAGGLLVVEGDPLYAYVLTPTSEVYVAEPSGLRLHQVLDRVYQGRPTIDRMWLAKPNGPGFVAGAHYYSALAIFDGDAYSYFTLPGVSRGFPGVGRTRDGRLIAAESFMGDLFIEDGAGWSPGPRLATRIFSFAPYGEEELMIFASNEGFVGVFHPVSGMVCEVITIESFGSIRDLVPIGDRYFLAGAGIDNVPAFGWLTPR